MRPASRLQSRLRSGLRGLLGVLLLSVFGALGCGKGVVPLEPVEVSPIDLSPRCTQAIWEQPPPTETDARSLPERRRAVAEESEGGTLSRGVRFVFEPTPRSGLASLAWGFPLPAEALSPDATVPPSFAAALLQAGETTAEPERFRSRVLAAGAELAAAVVGGWLWLEMRFPDATAQTAHRLFFEWLTPHPVADDALEAIRRQWVLTRLAEESAPGAVAEEVFRRVHPAPPGALRASSWGSAAGEPTPEQIQRLLESALRPEDSVVMVSGAGAAQQARSSVEAGLAAGAFAETRAPSAPDSPKRSAGTSSKDAPRAADPAIYFVDRPGAPQVEILMGFPTPAELDAEFEALEMLASLLGGNVGGRLFRDLRERQGLAYIINAEQSHEGRFVVRTRARPARVAALLSGIEAHLDALVSVPLQACEIEMLVERRLGEEALLANDPRAARQRARIDVALLGAPRSADFERARIFEAIELGLDEVARRRLAGAATVVLVGDAAGLADGLARFFPDRVVRVLEPDLSDLPRRSGRERPREAETNR